MIWQLIYLAREHATLAWFKYERWHRRKFPPKFNG